MDQAVEEDCRPDGGDLHGVVASIAALEQSGRLTYDPQAAARCLTAGREFMAVESGLAGLAATEYQSTHQDAIKAAITRECAGVLRGHQQPGEPCNWDPECDQGTTGAVCANRGTTPGTCEGVCRALAGVDQECGEDESQACQANLLCQRTDYWGKGVCIPGVAPENGRCTSDAGPMACPDDQLCIQGTCRNRLGVRQPCEMEGCEKSIGPGCGRDPCQPGMQCTGKPGQCTELLPEEAPCNTSDEDDLRCVDCLVCTHLPSDDAGMGRCRTLAQENEPCATRYCAPGLSCLNGTCVRSGRTGEACTVTEDDPEHARYNTQGTCLRWTDACNGGWCRKRNELDEGCVVHPNPPVMLTQGSCREDMVCATTPGSHTGTCKRNGVPGSPCTLATPSTLAQQAECQDQNLYCIRTHDTDVVGTCAAHPMQGEPCGDRYYLSNICGILDLGDGGSVSLDCVRDPDTQVGACMHYPVKQGEVCRGGMCAEGLYCNTPDGGFLGTCDEVPGVDQPCGWPLPWGDACRAGLYCKWMEDGTTQMCKPFEALGSPCSMASPVACGPEGTCPNGVCVPRGLVGESCIHPTDCEDGLNCVNNVCAEKGNVGESCMYAWDCQDGLICRETLCAPKPGLGEVCDYFEGCQGNLMCISSTCRQRQPIGGPCEDFMECEDGLQCRAGRCALHACFLNRDSRESCTNLRWTTWLLFFGAVVGWPVARRRLRTRG